MFSECTHEEGRARFKAALRNKNIIKKVIKIILMVLLGLAIAVLIGFALQWLWNTLVTDIFSLREITYWEGIGLFILAKIFFGGISGSSHSCEQHAKKAKSEFDREFDKDFEKEYTKEFGQHTKEEKTEQDNDDYDMLYEQWWKERGESSFNKFMSLNGTQSTTPDSHPDQPE